MTYTTQHDTWAYTLTNINEANRKLTKKKLKKDEQLEKVLFTNSIKESK